MSLSATVGVESETCWLPSADSTFQIHLRNKRPAGFQRFAENRIVLFVHGATYPAETAFDFDLPGGSWMEFAARRGFDTYCMDVRGYGRSSRPAAMSFPAREHPPFADTEDAVADISAVVDHILARREVSAIHLVGWSWGTATMATYTVRNPSRVNRLVLTAPLFASGDTPAMSSPVAGVGAYRTVEREASRARGVLGIPEGRVEEISPRAWFDRWFDANLALDADGAAQTPPVVRAPNGVVKDVGLYWAQHRSPYDPALLTVPVLLIVGEWDRDTPLFMAYDLFAKITNSPDKRLVVLGEGTHAMVLEKNRMRLITQVQQFLEA